MFKYWQRRQKNKLFQQWVEQGALSPEEVSAESQSKQTDAGKDLASDDVSRGIVPEYTTNVGVNEGMVHLPVRYVIIGLSIITLLLVILAVALTILIMRS